MNILILPRWYPNRQDPMPGLSIQRKAEVLAKSHQVVVISVHADPDCPNKFETEYSEEKGVMVIRVYYRDMESSFPGISMFRRLINFFIAYQKGLRIAGGYKPDIIHSYVLTRTGIIGYYLSFRYHAPHVISEFWSRYFPEQNMFKGWLRKRIARFLIQKAATVIIVSEKLYQAMQAYRLQNSHHFIVPNIVDTGIFFPETVEKSGSQKHFIHVSCFDDKSKNISGFLESVNILWQKRKDFHCTLIGVGPDLERMKTYAGNLGLTGVCVTFDGLRTGGELADLYRQADFTVQSSRFETFGNVIIESLACGTPIVSTDVGVASEVINVKNGILIRPGDTWEMTVALDKMLDQCNSYDPQEVRKTIEGRFTPEAVGHQLISIYSTLIAHD